MMTGFNKLEKMVDNAVRGRNIPALVVFFIFIVLLGSIITTCSLCWEYAIESWASYFKEKPIDIPLLPCFLLSVFFSAPAIPIAIITWIMLSIL